MPRWKAKPRLDPWMYGNFVVFLQISSFRFE